MQGRWLSWDLGLATAKGAELSALADRLVGTASSAGAVMTALRGGASGGIDTASRSRLMRQVDLPPAREVGVEPRFRTLDLRDVVNVRFDGSWPARVSMHGDIVTLGNGRHRLLGVDWRIDGGVQLSGGGPASVLHPEQAVSGWVGFPAGRRHPATAPADAPAHSHAPR